MDAILASIRCYVQSIAADLSLLQMGGHASTSDAVTKLESDAAGFMRASLRMYNLLEEKNSAVDASDVHASYIMVDAFVREQIDGAILSAAVLSCTGSTVSMLRDHTLLLANTLKTLYEELSNETLAPTAPCMTSSRKRDRKYD